MTLTEKRETVAQQPALLLLAICFIDSFIHEFYEKQQIGLRRNLCYNQQICFKNFKNEN